MTMVDLLEFQAKLSNERQIASIDPESTMGKNPFSAIKLKTVDGSALGPVSADC